MTLSPAPSDESEFLDQAVDRIVFAIQTEQSRRVVFLLGSGISVPLIPTSEQMIAFFLREMGGKAAGTPGRAETVADHYARVASQLKQRRGDTGVARAIRRAVLTAYNGDLDGADPNPETNDGDWKASPAHDLLAQIVAQTPRERRGPLFTTNFDPLIEVALRLRGIDVAAVAAPGGQAIHLDAIYDALPVVHLHGFWYRSSTLNTAAQIQRERPEIETMIKQQLSKSLLVIVGSGGWSDSFFRALGDLLRNGSLSMLDTEVLWMLHGDVGSVRDVPFLRENDGAPNLNIYANISAEALFSAVTSRLNGQHNPKADRPAVMGWDYIPAKVELTSPPRDLLLKFIEGGQPEWQHASVFPMLANGRSLLDASRRAADSDRGQVVVALGPTGEGKSLALRQVALELQSESMLPSSAILYRRVGAPRLNDESMQALLRQFDTVCLIADEADLFLDEIAPILLSLAMEDRDRVTVIMAMHAQYAAVSKVRARLSQLQAVEVNFGGMTESDALDIAATWLTLEVLPFEYAAKSADEIGQIILDSAASSHGDSIFAAVLHLWMSDDLSARLEDLLHRLSMRSIRDLSLKTLLAAIAVVQVACDPEELKGNGITSAVLGHMLGIVSSDVYSLVVEPLGKEVGLAQLGSCVYIRHPTIAAEVYDLLEEQEIADTARLVSFHAAQMRVSKGFSRSDYRSSFNLCRNLKKPGGLAAAHGAMAGAPRLLEPRVSYMATCRDNGHIDHADRYAARAVEHLRDYTDWQSSVRGFFVEWSTTKERLEELEDSLAIALISLTDLGGAAIDFEKARYGLVRCSGIAFKLKPRNVDVIRVIGTVCEELSFRLRISDHGVAYYSSVTLASLVRTLRQSAIEFRPDGVTSFPWDFGEFLEFVQRIG